MGVGGWGGVCSKIKRVLDIMKKKTLNKFVKNLKILNKRGTSQI